MNKIMSIDKDAENYRKGTYKLLKEKQDELEVALKDMRDDFQEEAKHIKAAIDNDKVMEAEHKARTIRKEKEEILNSINTKYESNKLVIVDEVFNRIIKSL